MYILQFRANGCFNLREFYILIMTVYPSLLFNEPIHHCSFLEMVLAQSCRVLSGIHVSLNIHFYLLYVCDCEVQRCLRDLLQTIVFSSTAAVYTSSSKK